MRIVFFVFLFCNLGLTQSVPFFKTYGGADPERGYSMTLTSDNGYILAGSTSSFGQGTSDIFIVKTDLLGDTIWTKTYGTVPYDIGYAIEETYDGGYIIAGQTGEPDTLSELLSDVFVIKTNSVGEPNWAFSWNPGSGDRAYDVKQTTDSCYIVTGVLNAGLNTGTPSAFLAKLSKQGSLLWNKVFESHSTAFSVTQSWDGGYLVSGYYGIPPQLQVYLVKTNANGEALWTKKGALGFQFGTGNSMVQTLDSNFVIAGSVYDDISSQVFLSKIAQTGDVIWTKKYGDDDDTCEGNAVIKSYDGGFIIAGSTNNNSPGPFPTADIWVIKTDKNGDTLWTRSYGTTTNEYGLDVQLSNTDGSIAIIGYTGLPADMFLLKIDSLGNAPILASVNNLPSKSEPSMQVYPNPVEYVATIELELPIKIANVRFTIFDYLGRAVQHFKKGYLQAGKNYTEINVTNLKSGTYFLKMSANGYSQGTKFVKH